MVKKMISRLSALAVLMVFVTACSKTSEYTNVIPADATAVASVNLKTLADKAGLDDKENEGMKQKMMDALKSGMNAAAFEQLQKVIKNPSESGIDVKVPVYVFSAPSFSYTAITAKVSSKENLNTTLEAMAKEQVCQPVAEEDGYSFTTMSGALLAFNETTALFVPVNGTSEIDNAKQAITNLMKQTADNSVSKNAGFQKMEKEKGDILFFASMAAIPEIYARQISMGLPAKVEPKDVMMAGSLSFEKGKIVAQFENYSENEEVKALLKEQAKATVALSTTFNKDFPEATLAYFNAGINGEEIYNLLLKNEDFRKNYSIAKAAETKKLFSAFKGDISAGLVNLNMQSSPIFLAFAETKDENAFKLLYDSKANLGLTRGQDIIKLGENEYVFKSKGMNVFFGIRNKQMYATNDELLYKNIGKPADPSIKSAGYASDMKGKHVFFVVNMEAILELPMVKMMIGFGGEEYQMYYKLASTVSFLEVSSDVERGEVTLVLKDKDVNALKQIVDFAKQFAGM